VTIAVLARERVARAATAPATRSRGAPRCMTRASVARSRHSRGAIRAGKKSRRNPPIHAANALPCSWRARCVPCLRCGARRVRRHGRCVTPQMLDTERRIRSTFRSTRPLEATA
jgi:hypothetical protein